MKRARIILLAADGEPSRRIARMVEISEEYVAPWRRRFIEERLAGLKDQPRSGRPRVYGHDDRVRIVATATTITPEATSHWSHPQLADALDAHYAPAHASWLNQVELWFSILSRRLLKRGEFASVDVLIDRIMAFIADYNRKAKPFRWTYDGSPLKVA